MVLLYGDNGANGDDGDGVWWPHMVMVMMVLLYGDNGDNGAAVWW